MSLQPRNPFYFGLAELEKKLSSHGLGDRIDNVAAPLDRIASPETVNAFTALLDSLAERHRVALEAQTRDLVAAHTSTVTALDKVADSIGAAGSAQVSPGVALMLLLVDLEGGWDERFDAGLRLQKIAPDLKALDRSQGASPKKIDNFVEQAPQTMQGDPPDPLFQAVTKGDARTFCTLVPDLLKAIRQGRPDADRPPIDSTVAKTTPKASAGPEPSGGKAR